MKNKASYYQPWKISDSCLDNIVKLRDNENAMSFFDNVKLSYFQG